MEDRNLHLYFYIRYRSIAQFNIGSDPFAYFLKYFKYLPVYLFLVAATNPTPCADWTGLCHFGRMLAVTTRKLARATTVVSLSTRYMP